MTFTGSLNTFQSDKEHWMTDHKALQSQQTERKFSVMTKTCHCSVPISALLISSAFNCMSLQEVPLPCLYCSVESLTLHCFPWCFWHLLRSAPSRRLSAFWRRVLNRSLCCIVFSFSPSETVCRGKADQRLLHLCHAEQLPFGSVGACCKNCRFGWGTYSFFYRHEAVAQTFTAVYSPEQVAFTLPSAWKIKDLHFRSYCCQW